MSRTDERELLEFGSHLSRHAQVNVPAEFRSRLRSSLLAAPVAFEAPSRAGRGFAFRPVFSALLVLALLAVAGGGAAAATSAPGDPAFGLKRAVEDAQVALAPDEVARLDTLLAQSDRRLVDLETATARRPATLAVASDEYVAAVARVDASLARVIAEPATPARDAAIARAATRSADHLARLQALAARLPDAAQRGIQRAIEVQQSVHGKSGNTPGGSSPTTVPGRPTTQPLVPAAPSAPPTRGGPPSGVPSRP